MILEDLVKEIGVATDSCMHVYGNLLDFELVSWQLVEI